MSPHALVTRPEGQQQGLVRALADAGLVVSCQSALCIEALALSARQHNLLLDLDQYHAVFFVSTNAAQLALQALQRLWPRWPVGVHWLAVGPATAEVLSAAGMAAQSPRTGFDSEALLELDCLRHLPGKRVLICRGDGGRELVAETLQRRGAEVDVLALYRRVCNNRFVWPTEAVDMVLVTSLQSWQCIADKVPVGEDQRQHLELSRDLARGLFALVREASAAAMARMKAGVPAIEPHEALKAVFVGAGVDHDLFDPRLARRVDPAVGDHEDMQAVAAAHAIDLVLHRAGVGVDEQAG